MQPSLFSNPGLVSLLESEKKRGLTLIVDNNVVNQHLQELYCVRFL